MELSKKNDCGVYMERDFDRFLRYLSDAVRGLNQTELF